MKKILKLKPKASSIFSKITNWLLLAYLFFLPTQFGKHFFFNFSFLNGIRVDYLAPTFYFLDLIFLALFFLNLKSIFNFFRKKTFLVLIFFLFFNALFSLNAWLTTYKVFRIFQWLTIFFLFSKNKLPAKNILLTLLASSLIQFFLAISQFTIGHSLQGVFYFLGERSFSLETSSIAKISFSGKEFLRAYGTFSHPNSLAGFYLLLYTAILISKKFQSQVVLKNILMFVFILLIFLSFSKTAIIALIVITLIFQMTKKNFCRVCVISRILVLICCGAIFLTGQTDPLSFAKRIELLENSLQIIKYNFLFGVGLNNYLLAQVQFPSQYTNFFNQPVHNVFLLIFAEAGFINLGVILFLTKDFLIKLLKSKYLLLLVLLFTGMADHYWWSLQQNFFLIAVIFGLEFV